MYKDYRKYRILLPENASLLDKDSKNFLATLARSSPTPFSPPASAFAHCVGNCLAPALKKLSSRAINNFFYLCRFHPFTLCLHLLTTFILWNEWHPNIKNHRVSLWEIFYKWNTSSLLWLYLPLTCVGGGFRKYVISFFLLFWEKFYLKFFA